jgi:plastocyanin
MDNETLFYVCGSVLAVSAVVLTFVGLKLKDFPGRALPIVILWFAIFVGGATTFAVLHAQDEEAAEATELETAGERIEEAESGGGAQGDETDAGGSETTLKLAADPTLLAFDQTELTAKAGKVTIDFDNPSATPHNVVILEGGKEVAGFAPITEGEETLSADLKAGTYTFICDVPGHAQAGMEGTLSVE